MIKRFMAVGFVLFSLIFSSIAVQSTEARVHHVVDAVVNRPHTLDHLQQQSYLQQRAQVGRPVEAIMLNDYSKWDYWSMGFGLGAGVLSSYIPSQDRRERMLWPDFRFGIERSWHLQDRFTCSVDFSFLTPGVRLGYLLNSDTRVTIGLLYWWLQDVKVRMPEVGATLPDTRTPEERMREYRVKNMLTFTPTISLDRFISRNCILRIALSLDRVNLYKDEVFFAKALWPQLTASVNFRF